MRTSRELIRSLQERIQLLPSAPPRERVTSGCGGLDRMLPSEGFCRGTLVEWLGAAGGGATTFAMIAAREASRNGRVVVVVDRARRFYPPAATACGIALENLVVVRPTSQPDFDWTMNQALRSSAAAAVVCWPESLESRSLRRWQLAAEAGGSLGLLVRPTSAANQSSWADLRLLVQTRPTAGPPRFQVELLRSRHGQSGRSVELELDDETSTLHLVPELAAPAPLRRAAET